MKAIFASLLLLAAVLVSAGCSYPTSETHPELCQQVELSANKDICLHRVAVTKADASLCAQIEGVQRRDLCYTDLAQGNGFATGVNLD